VDALARAIYEARFENWYLRSKGNSFQDKFADIMEKRYGTDFQRIRAGGQQGDHKADGYLRSTKTVFQVYAPDKLIPSTTNKKIDEDFKGARNYWQDRMSGWTFAHNGREGLLPEMVDLLDQIETDNQDITFERWGFEEIRKRVFELAENDIALLFGQAPSSPDLTKVSAEDLKPVIMGISTENTNVEMDIKPIPEDKLLRNQLSPSVQVLLRQGMSSANKVSRFFKQSTDPGLGDRIAGAFKYQYGVLKSAALSPDEIYFSLHDFVFEGTPTTRQESAILALLAFLFEQCDIFERVEIPTLE